MAVIQFFKLFFWYGENGSYLPESMHLVTWGINWRSLGLSEFILDSMGQFCDVILRRAALGTKYECLVWALLQNAAVYAQYQEMALSLSGTV